MIRVADYVAQLLVDNGVTDVFMVTGGGAMHLNDAIGRSPGLRPVFCHHEQACAIAAESYGRLSNRLAAVNVTTGPGGINALNGVFGAYVDSVAMIVVSGQVKRETTIGHYDLPLRQLGDQEVDIIALAEPVTKMAVALLDPADTRKVIEEAIWTARDGRPGPTWVDIPLDIQAAQVDPATLEGFTPPASDPDGPLTGAALRRELDTLLAHLAMAERPAVIVGAGVRLSGAHESFLRVIERLGIPVTTAWNAHDALWDDHPLYSGRPGTIGNRAGNFTVQNSDFLLVLGSRLNIRQISYNWEFFARSAYKVMIDVDAAELAKPTLKIDLPIHADLADVFALLEEMPIASPTDAHRSYLAWCRERLDRYSMRGVASPGSVDAVDPYYFIGRLFEHLAEGDIVVTGDGSACVMSFQIAHLKPGQRLYTNSGCASMGYDLPGAVGAAVAADGKRIVCIAGDGSMMLNIQELQTIAGFGLPIKIVVLNNDGYSSIRQTQNSYFPGGLMGCGPESGLTFPDFVAVGAAFGLPSTRCADPAEVDRVIDDLLADDAPALLEVMLDRDRSFEPKLSSRVLPDGRMISSPLEDMAPFLSREELAENLLIEPIAE